MIIVWAPQSSPVRNNLIMADQRWNDGEEMVVERGGGKLYTGRISMLIVPRAPIAPINYSLNAPSDGNLPAHRYRSSPVRLQPGHRIGPNGAKENNYIFRPTFNMYEGWRKTSFLSFLFFFGCEFVLNYLVLSLPNSKSIVQTWRQIEASNYLNSIRF